MHPHYSEYTSILSVGSEVTNLQSIQNESPQHTHTEKGHIMSNPFELRFKILEMAQSYLQEQQDRSLALATSVWEHAEKQGEATMELWNKLQPASYTIKDITEKATELYGFVEKK